MTTPRIARLVTAGALFVFVAAFAHEATAAPSCIDPRATGRMLLSDLRGLATTQFVPLGLGLGAAALVHPLDDNADAWVDAHGPSHLTKVGRLGGAWQTQVPLAAALVADSLIERCARPLNIDLIRALGVNLAVTNTLKFATQRERPNHESARLSFPSGHVSSTFALATVLQERAGWKAGAAAYGFATYTAWTRVRDDKHWISDTVFGGALGIAVGRAVVRTGRMNRWMVMPSASRSGVGVSVTRTP
ncbi:MAG: phosphatase PAP2 family protein [Vicinamibacterales bacterium]